MTPHGTVEGLQSCLYRLWVTCPQVVWCPVVAACCLTFNSTHHEDLAHTLLRLLGQSSLPTSIGAFIPELSTLLQFIIVTIITRGIFLLYSLTM